MCFSLAKTGNGPGIRGLYPSMFSNSCYSWVGGRKKWQSKFSHWLWLFSYFWRYLELFWNLLNFLWSPSLEVSCEDHRSCEIMEFTLISRLEKNTVILEIPTADMDMKQWQSIYTAVGCQLLFGEWFGDIQQRGRCA